MSAESITVTSPTTEANVVRDPDRRRRWFLNVISALAILGMADSGLLTVHHYHEMNLPSCSAAACGKVLTSWWAHPILGIPTSAFGFVYYAIVYLLPSFNVPPRPIVPLAALAFCIHLGFVYIQAFIIHAYCNYCLLSAATTTLIFILMVALARASGPPSPPAPPPPTQS